MPRYKLTIEYDGTPFVGWQQQTNGPSIQAELTRAIFSFSGESRIPLGAGRTDAGVHAIGQVAHVDLLRDHPSERVREALNYHLRPSPITVLSCENVSADFNARFSAKARHYLYRIINRKPRLALEPHRAWLVPQPLDVERMVMASEYLLGRHDFTTFRSTQCQAKSPIRTLDTIKIGRQGETISLSVSARSFLHNQVRSIVGSLKLVGQGKWCPEDLQAALKAENRAACGPVAPACGLYLMKVDY